MRSHGRSNDLKRSPARITKVAALMILFDEASAIDDRIWEVCEGAMSDANTELLWFAFGNPTRNTGRFRECFDGRFRDRWITHQIDSREVKITNKKQIAEWIADYTEDSDFARVRIRGVFPRAGQYAVHRLGCCQGGYATRMRRL